MAPNPSTPREDPSSSSSSEEEEESSGQEEDDGEQEQKEEDEEKIKDGTALESEFDSEYESGSEADSKFLLPDPNVKPMEDNTQKPHSKSNTATLKPADKVKRASETGGVAEDAKRAKKDPESEGAAAGKKAEDAKKHFQRLWSEKDEIAVLNGMIGFTAKKGVDPSKDMVAFHDFIKKDLHIEVQLSQVKDKVWRLKKKFKNNVKKGKKGKERAFSKVHDQKVFNLSKKIWGGAGTSGHGWGIGNKLAGLKVDLGLVQHWKEGVVGTNDGKSVGLEMEMLASFGKFGWCRAMDEYVLQKGMELLNGSKKDEMEDRLQKLHVRELELFIKRNDLVRELTELVLAAYNKRDKV